MPPSLPPFLPPTLNSPSPPIPPTESLATITSLATSTLLSTATETSVQTVDCASLCKYLLQPDASYVASLATSTSSTMHESSTALAQETGYGYAESMAMDGGMESGSAYAAPSEASSGSGSAYGGGYRVRRALKGAGKRRMKH